ncbi:MAG: DUF488 domain-containing protein [Planctomycetota bacterium]|nr:DUF488 domain-containing protein [Planctomycetota bacterium]
MRHSEITLYTIGFAGKSAEQFFAILRRNNVRKILDVRLFNRSQLSGFTKQQDLEYFLQSILGAGYQHLPEFAPTKLLLDGYKKGHISWDAYRREYLELIEKRRPHERLIQDEADGACLLCSESPPDFCHRRLAAEYLKKQWGNVRIVHL